MFDCTLNDRGECCSETLMLKRSKLIFNKIFIHNRFNLRAYRESYRLHYVYYFCGRNSD
jgi:hypothetical protein